MPRPRRYFSIFGWGAAVAALWLVASLALAQTAGMTPGVAGSVARLAAFPPLAASPPEALAKQASISFPWGGTAFSHAPLPPNSSVAAVYHNRSAAFGTRSGLRAAALGSNGGNNNRVNAMIPPAEAELEQLRKLFEVGADRSFPGRPGRDRSDKRTSEQVWPRSVSLFKQQLK